MVLAALSGIGAGLLTASVLPWIPVLRHLDLVGIAAMPFLLARRSMRMTIIAAVTAAFVTALARGEPVLVRIALVLAAIVGAASVPRLLTLQRPAIAVGLVSTTFAGAALATDAVLGITGGTLLRGEAWPLVAATAISVVGDAVTGLVVVWSRRVKRYVLADS